VGPPEGVEPGRETGDSAGADSDGVVDELRAERNLELEQGYGLTLASQAGNGDEAVEVQGATSSGVEVDRVPSAEQPGHHGLGHAGGEAGPYDGVGRAPAGLEDLGSHLGCGGMPRGDGSHALSVLRVPIL
jgi:hypothetical protein